MMAMAQNEDDAIRYSNIVPQGTAKFISMSGAMGAIGGDLTAVTINPAGTAIFRNDYFSLSPMWKSDKVSASYYGTNTNSNISSFKFSNIGTIATFPFGESGCESINMGFVYNRTYNFEGGHTVKGTNEKSSMLDKEFYDFENDNYWEKNLFYESNLFFYDSTDNQYHYDYDYAATSRSNQRRTLTSSGSMGEYAFLIGVNINNAWYLGGSLNIVRINYRQVSKYTEEPDSKGLDLDDFTVIDEFSTQGGGANLKLGLIGWLNENIRIGAAFHTPTILNLSDNYGTRIDASIIKNDYSASTSGGIDWNLTLPAKFIGSFAYVLPELGMLDIDCEVVNYGSTVLDDDNESIGNEYDDLNDHIADIYRTTVNLRVGGELMLGPAVARAGFGFYGSPYKSGYENSSANKQVYSVGLGLRSQIASLDLGYSLTTQKETTYLYGFDDSAASLKKKTGILALTLNFRF